MAGLFDTFTIAKRGLSVQQSNINTSSHNIANASTDGYSRQRSVAHTTRPFGGMSRFDTCTVGQVGTGAEISQIMRIRDSFLDYQVRNENTNYGTANVKNDYLTQVEDILNETSDTGIQTYLSNFYNKFQDLSTTSGASKDTNRTNAFKAAEQLADLIRSKYSQIDNKKSDAQKELRNQTTSINSILDQINDLSKQISSVCAVGMSPNDLMDSRDLLIDQLSTKFGVKIEKEQRETMNLSATEEQSIGNLVNSEPTDQNYVRFSYVESAEFKQTGTNSDGTPIYDYTQLTVNYSVLGDKNNQKTITISDTDVNKMKALQKNLIEDRMLVGDKDGIVNTTNLVATGAAPGNEADRLNTLASSIIGTGSKTTADFTTATGWTQNTGSGGVVTSATKSSTTGTVTTTTTVNFDTTGKVTNFTEVIADTSTPATTTTSTIQVDGSEKVISAESKTVVTGGTTTDTIATGFDATGKITNANKIETPNGSSSLTWSADQMESRLFNKVTKGEIAGDQQVQDNMQEYMDKLDKFAAAFAYTVNAIQTGSRGSTYTTDPGIEKKDGTQVTNPELIFVVKKADGTISSTDTGITAKNITFNDVLEQDPSKLNCGKYSVDDYSGEGDGSRALAMADVAKLKINIGNLDIASGDISSRDKFFQDTGLTFDSNGLELVTSQQGSTVGDYYGTVLSDVYSANQKAANEVSNEKVLLDSLNTQRQSVSGVSLDEEMTDLIQFQHAYQANAKMINTIDQLLDVVINGLKA